MSILQTSRVVLWLGCALLIGSGILGAYRSGLARTQEMAPAAAEAGVEDAAPGVQGEEVPSTMALSQEGAPAAAVAFREARAEVRTSLAQRLVSVLGIAAILLIAWALSADRRAVPWRVIFWGLGLQFLFAVFILRTGAGAALFASINGIILALLGFTVQGARFLFGNLVDPGVPVTPGAPGVMTETGAFFAFNVLPTIIFFSSFMTVLYHIGAMQWILKGIAWIMMRTMRTSGAETLSAAGNIFVGQSEAPLLIKPFVARMTMSELNAVMVGGFATVAGGVMAAYVGMLVAFFPDIAGHLLAASVMSAPAGLVVAKIMVPEREVPITRGSLRVEIESPDANVIDAAARGAGEGLTLALNVGAMLLAFIALISLLNALLGWVADVAQISSLLRGWGWLAVGQPLTLELMLGWLLAPLAWIMGVPWRDAVVVGTLLGVKTVLNEFVAFLQLAAMLAEGTDLSPRSVIIATYALAGFANFSSIAMQIGGLGGIAPSRRGDLSRLGLRAMIGGSLAAFLTATVAGILV